MNQQMLIDAIVRQTTVLIARLSTAEGVRSPLAHVANEVFIGLVRELEQQGLGKKVIADMFGLALRSYRQKVQRLGESATTGGVTLWAAIHEFLNSRDSATRDEILARFKNDDEISIRGILNDLVQSGLVVLTGKAEQARYRIATEDELLDVDGRTPAATAESNAALVWLHVYHSGPVTQAELAKVVALPTDGLEHALSALVSDGRVKFEARDAETYYITDQCLIPVGDTAGWEAAVIDHHGTVLNALVAKLAGGSRRSTPRDEVGGTTLTFELWPGHPREREVRQLLATCRKQVIGLWDEVATYNIEHAPADTYQVHFYCGQYVAGEDAPE